MLEPADLNEAPIIELDSFLPYLFHVISSRLSAQLLERMRPYGITVARWRVLIVLMNRDGRSIGDLAQLTLIEQSALSRVIDQMERDHLVVRRTSLIDGRSVEVHLTAHGRTTYFATAPAAAEHAQAIVKSFTASEQKTLTKLIAKVCRNLDLNIDQVGNGGSAR